MDRGRDGCSREIMTYGHGHGHQHVTCPFAVIPGFRCVLVAVDVAVAGRRDS